MLLPLLEHKILCLEKSIDNMRKSSSSPQTQWGLTIWSDGSTSFELQLNLKGRNLVCNQDPWTHPLWKNQEIKKVTKLSRLSIFQKKYGVSKSLSFKIINLLGSLLYNI